MKKEKRQLSATTLSWVLIGLIIFFIIGAYVGTWYLGTVLHEHVSSVRKLENTAVINANNLSFAKSLKTFLEANTDSVTKASSIVAETKMYQYQNQIVQDVTHFADIAGVTILGFDFPTNQAASKQTKAGVKSLAATVMLQTPLSYNNYLKFLRLIEQNLTRMQITNISITPDDTTPGLISNPLVGLEVYVK